MSQLEMYEHERRRKQELRDFFNSETMPVATARMDVSPHHYAHHKGVITLGLRGGFFVAASDIRTERANEHFQKETDRDNIPYRHDCAYRTLEGALDGAFRDNLRYSPQVISGRLHDVITSEPEEKSRFMSTEHFRAGSRRPLDIDMFSMVDAVKQTGEPPLKVIQDTYYAGKISGSDPRCYAAFLATKAQNLRPRKAAAETNAPDEMGFKIEDSVMKDRGIEVTNLKLWASGADRDTRLRLAGIEKCRKSEAPGSLKSARDLEAFGLELHRAGRTKEALLPLVVAAKQAQAERHLVMEAGRPSRDDGAR